MEAYNTSMNALIDTYGVSQEVSDMKAAMLDVAYIEDMEAGDTDEKEDLIADVISNVTTAALGISGEDFVDTIPTPLLNTSQAPVSTGPPKETSPCTTQPNGVTRSHIPSQRMPSNVLLKEVSANALLDLPSIMVPRPMMIDSTNLKTTSRERPTSVDLLSARTQSSEIQSQEPANIASVTSSPVLFIQKLSSALMMEMTANVMTETSSLTEPLLPMIMETQSWILHISIGRRLLCPQEPPTVTMNTSEPMPV